MDRASTLRWRGLVVITLVACAPRPAHHDHARGRAGIASAAPKTAAVRPDTAIERGPHVTDEIVTLAESAVAAITAADEATLMGLIIDEAVYAEDRTQAALSNVPGQRVPAKVLWANMNGKSEENVRFLVQRYGAQRWTLTKVELDRVEERGPFRLYRDVQVEIEDIEGSRQRWTVFGGVLEDTERRTTDVLFFDARGPKAKPAAASAQGASALRPDDDPRSPPAHDPGPAHEHGIGHDGGH